MVEKSTCTRSLLNPGGTHAWSLHSSFAYGVRSCRADASRCLHGAPPSPTAARRRSSRRCCRRLAAVRVARWPAAVANQGAGRWCILFWSSSKASFPCASPHALPNSASASRRYCALRDFFFGDVLRARRCRRVSNSSSDMICSHSQFNARRGLLYKSICLISCCKYF